MLETVYDIYNKPNILIYTSVASFICGVSSTILYLRFLKSEDRSSDNHTHILNIKSVSEYNDVKKYSTETGIEHKSVHYEDFKGCIYLDYNATCPIFPEVTTAMEPYNSILFGNPSSYHIYSVPSKAALLKAREYVGSLINAPNYQNTIYFTSCGSESDNRAIDIGVHNFKFWDVSGLKPNIITSSIEHPAILCYLKHLETSGIITCDIIPVNNEGIVDIDSFKSMLKVSTALVTIMHSNNEVGTIQPIREISDLIKSFNKVNNTKILFHVDAAQSLGKVEVNVNTLGIDMLTVVGHKFGAPKGVAALYINESISTCPMLHGGGQERGLRAGTENLLLIVGLGEASRIAKLQADEILIHMLTLKHRLMTLLIQGLSKINSNSDFYVFNGPRRSIDINELTSDLKMMNSIVKMNLKNKNMDNGGHSMLGSTLTLDQLPNTISISFRNLKASNLLNVLFDKVACSPGSACHSVDNSEHLSPVIEAMKIPAEFGLGTLRLSLGRHTSKSEVERAAAHIVNAVKFAYENQ